MNFHVNDCHNEHYSLLRQIDRRRSTDTIDTN